MINKRLRDRFIAETKLTKPSTPSAEEIERSRLVVSTSGGKDSTAMCLTLMERGFSASDYDRVFFDTGWEHPETYEYLDKLELTVGPIKRLKANIPISEEHRHLVVKYEERLGFESPMIRRVFQNLFFSSRTMKWCTKDLKIKPAEEYFYSQGDECISLVGIRRDESKKRSTMTEWEWSYAFDCWVWRPIIDWSFSDVIDIHKRFDLMPNPLYLNGSNRVGCWPCIMSRKREIAQLDDHRASIIRDLENDVSRLKGGTARASTFFQTMHRKHAVMTIDMVMQWAKGGNEIELFSNEEPTCVKWGLCNT
jgi:3'-phosphoadenosine 5'-phosphosulfate sulfotransferase (PAPS reductase)/FAD synthetase